MLLLSSAADDCHVALQVSVIRFACLLAFFPASFPRGPFHRLEAVFFPASKLMMLLKPYVKLHWGSRRGSVDAASKSGLFFTGPRSCRLFFSLAILEGKEQGEFRRQMNVAPAYQNDW